MRRSCVIPPRFTFSESLGAVVASDTTPVASTSTTINNFSELNEVIQKYTIANSARRSLFVVIRLLNPPPLVLSDSFSFTLTSTGSSYNFSSLGSRDIVLHYLEIEYSLTLYNQTLNKTVFLFCFVNDIHSQRALDWYTSSLWCLIFDSHWQIRLTISLKVTNSILMDLRSSGILYV